MTTTTKTNRTQFNQLHKPTEKSLQAHTLGRKQATIRPNGGHRRTEVSPPVNGELITRLPDTQVYVVDSRLLAAKCGVQHQNLRELIETHQATITEAFGVLRFETGKPSGGSLGGRPERYALLTEDQATFVITLTRNTPQVVAFKAALVQAFAEARRHIAAQQPTFEVPKTLLEAMEMETAALREKEQLQLASSAVTVTCGTEGKPQRCEQDLPNSSKRVLTGSYAGHLIHFHVDDAFVNATEMCAAFGKRPDDFFSHTAYLALHESLAEALNTRLVVSQDGGTLPGIWMHPELALVCARWLSPDFFIWCSGIIMRILLGELEVQSPFGTPQTYSVTLQQAAEKAERFERFKLQKQVVCEVIKKASLKLAEVIRELESKMKKVYIPMNVACSQIDPTMGRRTCFNWLRAEGILHPGAGGMPYTPYITEGYFHIRRSSEAQGQNKTALFMTPAGVVFAHELRQKYYQGVSPAALKEAQAIA